MPLSCGSTSCGALLSRSTTPSVSGGNIMSLATANLSSIRASRNWRWRSFRFKQINRRASLSPSCCTKNATSTSATRLPSSNHKVADGMLRLLLFNLDKVTLERDSRNNGARMALEIRRARHLNLPIIADDIYNGIGAKLFSAPLQRDHRREEGPVAGLFVGLAKRIGLAVGYITAKLCHNLRVFLLAKEEFHQTFKFFVGVFGCHGGGDRQNVLSVARISRPHRGQQYTQNRYLYG